MDLLIVDQETMSDFISENMSIDEINFIVQQIKENGLETSDGSWIFVKGQLGAITNDPSVDDPFHYEIFVTKSKGD